MAAFARVAMRASMMLAILLVTGGAFLAARTPAQHLTVALALFLYCAIRSGGGRACRPRSSAHSWRWWASPRR